MKNIEFQQNYNGSLDSVYIDGEPCERITGGNSPNGFVGTAGRVFLHPEYVVKSTYPDYPRGEIFLDIDEEDKDYFAETVFVSLDKSFLIQKRVTFRPDLRTPEAEMLLQSMIYKYNIGDIKGEYPFFNCTIDENGVPKIFDYEVIES